MDLETRCWSRSPGPKKGRRRRSAGRQLRAAGGGCRRLSGPRPAAFPVSAPVQPAGRHRQGGPAFRSAGVWCVRRREGAGAEKRASIRSAPPGGLHHATGVVAGLLTRPRTSASASLPGRDPETADNCARRPDLPERKRESCLCPAAPEDALWRRGRAWPGRAGPAWPTAGCPSWSCGAKSVALGTSFLPSLVFWVLDLSVSHAHR